MGLKYPMTNKHTHHISSEMVAGKLVIYSPKDKCLVSKKDKYLIQYRGTTVKKMTIEGAAIAVKKALNYGNLTQIEDAIKTHL